MLKWREWPPTAWGYWDHTPITIALIMLIAIACLPISIILSGYWRSSCLK